MAGSSYGTIFRITTWGESHGPALGVVIDGCPAGMPLCEEDIQCYLDRRKPGQSALTTPRREADAVEILSGIFEGKTTGTPLSLLVRNTSQNSHDYREIASCYRPGHADYTFDEKYGFRDYRGGGRSSGRETIGRVAAGAIAAKFLQLLGISVCAYTHSIGPVSIDHAVCNYSLRLQTPTCMPDLAASKRAESYLAECMQQKDSSGGIIECMVTGCPAGIGDPVFEKLDANLAKAIMSIGAVKAVEIGDGTLASQAKGSQNNDPFRMKDGHPCKASNHSGGVLGGISDGAPLLLRAHVKPTPSIFSPQDTVSQAGENISVEIHGRHDPVIVPRAVVVVEAMTAITVLDALLLNMSSKAEDILRFYQTER